MTTSVIASLCDADFITRKKSIEDFGIGKVDHSYREFFSIGEMADPRDEELSRQADLNWSDRDEEDHIMGSVYPEGYASQKDYEESEGLDEKD